MSDNVPYSTADQLKAACLLTGEEPLSCRMYPNGSMAVVLQSGEKHFFTPAEVSAMLKNPISQPSGNKSPATAEKPVIVAVKRSHHAKRT